MQKLLLLIRASCLDGVRWARGHLYTVLVLGPLVLGLTGFTATRLAHNFQSVRISSLLALGLASGAWLWVIALTLSRATAEIYHQKRPESEFDSFPIPGSTFLYHALASRIARVLAIAVILAVARYILIGAMLIDLTSLITVCLLVALTANVEIYGAINWIHWGHTRGRLNWFFACYVMLGSAPIAGHLILSILTGRPQVQADLLFLTAATAVLLVYLITGIQHQQWRASDVEYARRLRSGDAARIRVPRIVARKLSRSSAVQVVRDLQLTARGFSSAVYVAVTLALLWPLAMVAAIHTYLPPASTQAVASWLDATWLPHVMAIKGACVLEICTLAALTPVLVAHQLPRFWLERAIGASGQELWNAKLWYARLVTLPGALLVCTIGVLTFTTPGYYIVPMLAECLWLWWMISSVTGALAFEMPTRPGLALVFTITVALAIGVIGALAWPAGLLTHAQAMHGLADRGSMRARYYMITEAE